MIEDSNANKDELIELYLLRKLSGTTLHEFKEKLAIDDEFKREVALQKAIIQNIKAVGRKEWARKLEGLHNESGLGRSDKYKKRYFLAIPYATAACLLLAVALYFFTKNESTQLLADKYIRENLLRLSKTMNASSDSMQQALEYYNNKQYDSALKYFEGIYNSSPPHNSNAKKYMGYVYILRKDYDKAIREFTDLSQMELFTNPGLFLKAVALMERNKKGDKEQAKNILEQVIQKKLEGSKEAEEWLKKW